MPKTMKEPPGATLDPEFITFEAWIEKVEDVRQNQLQKTCRYKISQ